MTAAALIKTHLSSINLGHQDQARRSAPCAKLRAPVSGHTQVRLPPKLAMMMGNVSLYSAEAAYN